MEPYLNPARDPADARGQETVAVRVYPTMFRLLFEGGLRFRVCCSSPISSCYSNAIHLKKINKRKRKGEKKKNRAQCNFCSKTFLLSPLYESHFIKLALYWYLYIYGYVRWIMFLRLYISNTLYCLSVYCTHLDLTL